MRTWKIVLNLFILMCIAAALINTEHFGDPAVASLFLFTGFASIATVITFAGQLFFPRIYAGSTPLYIKIFLLLVLYIFLHGLLSGYTGLTHYYWFAYGLFFCIVNFSVRLKVAENKTVSCSHPVAFLFLGVAVLALADSLLVFFQYGGLVKSLNGFFKASGSWENPNVTAMFLAVSLSAVVWLLKNTRRMGWKLLILVTFIVIIAAIGTLKCRSAYIFTFILLAAEALPVCKRIYQGQLKLSPGLVVAALLAIALTVAAGMISIEKKTSAVNRIGIWKTSVDMMFQKPLQGYGIDAFEKEYNLFAAEKKNPVNDYVGMVYNDFLELGIEGGMPAMLLWTAFLICVFYFYYRRKEWQFILPLLAGFVLMQVSNFVFQSLPVMALFIVYLAVGPYLVTRTGEPGASDSPVDKKKNIAFSMALVVAASVLAIITSKLAYGFYQTAQIKKKMLGAASIQAYKKLEKHVKDYAFFHESFGNAYLQENDIVNAQKQYLMALQYTSKENVLDNCGYCYQALGRYDSSEYYYTVLRNMAPHKFGPRFRLLKLFEQKGDTARLIQTATEITIMPVKVKGQQVEYIKRYAELILQLKNSK
jgi:O-antigen polymerase